MPASQSALLQLYLLGFLTGAGLSFLYDLLYMLRLWLLPAKKRYTAPAVARIYAQRVSQKPNREKGRAFRAFLFLGDVFFCLVSALALIFLLYGLNDGVFRVSAPLCMALGFAATRVALSPSFRILLQYAAFGLEMLTRAFLSPVLYFFRRFINLCKKAVLRYRKHKHAKQRKKYTHEKHLNIDKTAAALFPIPDALKKRRKKGFGRARQSKKTG